jgi:hypothetical protein
MVPAGPPFVLLKPPPPLDRINFDTTFVSGEHSNMISVGEASENLHVNRLRGPREFIADESFDSLDLAFGAEIAEVIRNEDVWIRRT